MSSVFAVVECAYPGCKTLLAGKRSKNNLCAKHEGIQLGLSKKKKTHPPTPAPTPLLPAPKPTPRPPPPNPGATSVESAGVSPAGRVRRGHRKLIEDLKRKIAGRARSDEADETA